jgi:hypothetical protein
MRCRMKLLVMIGLAAMAAARAEANPSTSQLQLPLAIRNEEPSRKLLERLVPIDRRAAELIDQLDGRRTAGTLGSADFGIASEAAAAVFYLRALGERLGARGEAAGSDFLRRASDYDRRLKMVVAELKKSSQFQPELIERSLAQLQAAGQARLPELRQQTNRGEYEAAELGLMGILAEMERYAVWLENTDRFASPFKLRLAENHEPLMLARQTQLAADIAALIAKEELGHEAFLARVDTAAAELKRTGEAPWNGKALTGPELIAHVISEWQLIHQRAMRRRALELIRRGGNTNAVGPAADLEEADLAFAGHLRTALADLVEADAARATAEQASQLYFDYVQAFSRPLLLVSDRAGLVAAVQPGLSQLAAKDQILDFEVRAYEESTSELLRWRRRVARAGATRLQATHPALILKFTEAARGGPDDPALLADSALSSSMALLGPAPNALKRLHSELIGKPCTTSDVVGLGGGKAIGRYSGRVYTRLSFPVSPRQQAEVAALRRDLLVTDESGALSLDAAAVLAGAEQDCYERVGGIVQEIYLEPLLTRFATLSDRSTGLTPPDAMPGEPLSSDLRSHVLARCDLVPRWLQHECFVVELEAPAEPLAKAD